MKGKGRPARPLTHEEVLRIGEERRRGHKAASDAIGRGDTIADLKRAWGLEGYTPPPIPGIERAKLRRDDARRDAPDTAKVDRFLRHIESV